MHNNNLIDLLKTFSKQETRDFGEFIKSPLYNKRQAVISLYEIIIKFYPDFEDERLSKDKVMLQLFPGKKYKESSLRVLTHFLISLAEKFFAYRQLEKNKIESSYLIGIELYERKQYKLLEKNMLRSFELIEEADLDAEEYFHYKYLFENAKTYFLFASNYAFFDKILSKSSWEDVSKQLSNFYVFKSLNLYMNTLLLKTKYNTDLKFDTLKNNFDNINIEEFENIPVIKVYYFIIMLHLETGNDSHFFKVKDLLKAHKVGFNKYDVMGIYVSLENYCLKKIAEGRLEFERELFNIFREEIGDKVSYLTTDGFMSPIFYRNVVTSGLKLKEYAFIKDFIHTYKPILVKKFRDNYFYYCLALYEFNTGNYEAAMELNTKIKYDEIYMKLNSKILQMQLFYETGADDSLIAAIETFRHFLINDKLVPAKVKTSFSNFHKYLTKILNYKNKSNKDKSEAGLLKRDLKNNNSVIAKVWILEKIEEII